MLSAIIITPLMKIREKEWRLAKVSAGMSFQGELTPRENTTTLKLDPDKPTF